MNGETIALVLAVFALVVSCASCAYSIACCHLIERIYRGDDT